MESGEKTEMPETLKDKSIFKTLGGVGCGCFTCGLIGNCCGSRV